MGLMDAGFIYLLCFLQIYKWCVFPVNLPQKLFDSELRKFRITAAADILILTPEECDLISHPVSRRP